MLPDQPQPAAPPFWISVNNTEFENLKVCLMATNVAGGCFTLTVTMAPGSPTTTETAFHPGLYHVGGRQFEDATAHSIRAGAAAVEARNKEALDRLAEQAKTEQETAPSSEGPNPYLDVLEKSLKDSGAAKKFRFSDE